MSPTDSNRPRLAIIGAGPAGLEAALAAAERGWSFRLYEAGDRPAAHVRSWGHVRLFSPWSMNVSERARRALEAAGQPVPDGDACPTGDELADQLLDPIAELPQVAPHLVLGTKVETVGRRGLLKHQEISTPERAGRPFRLLVTNGDGSERIEESDAVLDTSGAFTHPNPLGDGGIPAPGERAAGGAIHRRLPDLAVNGDDWAGRTTLLVGAGHSAQTAARDLAELAATHDGTRVVWSFRATEPSWVIEDDVLPERAALTAEAERIARGGSDAFEVHPGTVIEAIEPTDSGAAGLRVTLRSLADGSTETVRVDRILALTGATGDHHLYRELQVHECYASGAPMKLAAALLSASGGGGDCTTQTGHGPETLVNPEPRFFILGAKSYGRSGNYLMRLGAEQVEDAFSLLDESFGA